MSEHYFLSSDYTVTNKPSPMLTAGSLLLWSGSPNYRTYSIKEYMNAILIKKKKRKEKKKKTALSQTQNEI
jgi:hemolysin-activating ACP:hemolysin acyltransferase